ncbi:DUF1330 domain-containing protein [Nocardioides sp.]|uniref:DUF1330 domain-containing protein n=1 Tax=Nocardioides sp. TaxID=35761 RepID=UPI00352923D4
MAVDPTREDLQRFLDSAPEGPIVMLNLLRFVPGGAELYARYAREAAPFLAKHGAEVVYAGDGHDALVAEDGQSWDAVLLVRYPSVQAFAAMIADPGYWEVTTWRTQALAEAVLQPTSSWT